MKVAIISDSHDNIENIEKFLQQVKESKIEKIICLGDVAKIETLKFLSDNFLGEIFLVRGNADLYETSKTTTLQNIRYLDEVASVEIEGVKTCFVHESEKIKRYNLLEKAPDFIFYGHSHKPWLEKQEKTIIANPGTLGGINFQASYAILNTINKNLELKILDL